ncbi:MAG: hypothetical protein RIS45_723 [Planctomycetota bacterium]|jgi:hypothetical protein
MSKTVETFRSMIQSFQAKAKKMGHRLTIAMICEAAQISRPHMYHLLNGEQAASEEMRGRLAEGFANLNIVVSDRRMKAALAASCAEAVA